ncbi:MAG: hypothetical protein HUU13_00320 [Burkholderiaceae bacterium]|jgi:hypothetical protein|nr:hypothetical protein [Burkholderiaceae bacterium]
MSFEKNLNWRRTAVVCLWFAQLAGCAAVVSPPVVKPDAKAVMHKGAPIQYADELLQTEISQAGLLLPFNDYWSAHIAKDWLRLHSFEAADAPVSVEFYVPYHARAWHVSQIEILKIQLDANEAHLTLRMELRNPDDGKARSMHRQDKWVRIDGVWRHWVTDPMLTGNR